MRISGNAVYVVATLLITLAMVAVFSVFMFYLFINVDNPSVQFILRVAVAIAAGMFFARLIIKKLKMQVNLFG